WARGAVCAATFAISAPTGSPPAPSATRFSSKPKNAAWPLICARWVSVSSTWAEDGHPCAGQAWPALHMGARGKGHGGSTPFQVPRDVAMRLHDGHDRRSHHVA